MELKDKVGLIPILRAGLGMVEGVWELMPTAEVWHIGLYRDERTLKPVQYYNKLPVAPTVSVCLILDPMLATGGSAG
jgi:uracil phosphoribosyltransferase